MFGTLLTAAMAAGLGFGGSPLGGSPLPDVQGPTWKCPAHPRAILKGIDTALEATAATPDQAVECLAADDSPASFVTDILRRLSGKTGELIGAGAGAAVGAKIGLMVGGPAGAILGGFLGGFVGGAVGDVVGTKAVKPPQ